MPVEVEITEYQEHEFGIVVSFKVFSPSGDFIAESSLSYSKLMSERKMQASIRAEAEQLISEKSVSAPDISHLVGQRMPLASLPNLHEVIQEEED